MKRMTKLLVAALISTSVASGSAATEEAAGVYYSVPLQILKGPNAVTSGTGQLLVYSRDNGTTAVQLLVQADPDTIGFVLHRETTPEIAGVIFGSIEELLINYRPMNRPTGITDYQAFELLEENGSPPGKKFQLFDAAGEPLTNIQLTYNAQASAMNPKSTTGTARLLPGGYVYLPESPVTQRMAFSNYRNFRLGATEPDLGTTIEDISQTNRNSGDGVTTLTLPFLNDWDTTATGIDIYNGQIIKNDGTPAANAPFTVFATTYRNNADPFDFDSAMMHRNFTAGPDGRFLLAFKQPQKKTKTTTTTNTNTTTSSDFFWVMDRGYPPSAGATPHIQLQINIPGLNNTMHTLVPGESSVIQPVRCGGPYRG